MRVLFLLFAVLAAPSLAAADPINAIVGDASWTGDPSAASEVDRIRAHLAFVEGLLRPRTERLTPQQRARRARALDALASYRRAGVFPRRTSDPYPGRHPRFIDDRGVHCAVGEMIRATGHPELARRIDARFEYAYVEAIDEPGLARWAKAHGFTTKELAMVQPGYDPVPTAESIEAEVREATERITLKCARAHEPADSFRLRVRFVPHDSVRFRSIRWFDDFVQCFLDEARASISIGRGAYDQELHRVRTWTRVHVEPPQSILDRRMAALRFHAENTGCAPYPGPIPEWLSLRVRVDDQGFSADVSTTPSNAAVEACLERYVTAQIGEPFGPGRWRLDSQIEHVLHPRVKDESLQRWLEGHAATLATECWEHGEPDQLRVTVRAERDAAALTIGLEGANEAFVACFEPKLRERLRAQVTVHRDGPDGTRTPYFRIDGDASASTTFSVETPDDREARIRRQHEAMERELERARY